MAPAALIGLILTNLPTIKSGATHLINFVREQRLALRQSGEWTPDMDREFEAELARRAGSSAYRPDNR